MNAHKKVNFKSVAIYTHYKPQKEKIEKEFLAELVEFLQKNGVKNITGDVRTVSLLRNSIELVDDEKKYDLKIGIGGDGTLLKMIRTLRKKDGLFLGINFGTLGFLSELTPNNAIEALAEIFAGKFFVDERMILKSFVWRKNSHNEKEKVFRAYALNDFSFGHGGLARLTNFRVNVQRRKLSVYRSDGLIFATPTGSTAYSLSAGGPIVSHDLDAVVVTPVAPHQLSHRPIVIPSNKAINISFDSRVDSISMTVDGQIHFSLKSSDEVTIQRATRRVKFIRLKKNHFFRTLRSKMGWGERK